MNALTPLLCQHPWSDNHCKVLFTSEQPKKKNKMSFVGILSQIKLLSGPLVIQVVWYVLEQLFTSVSVKVVYICLYLLIFTYI